MRIGTGIDIETTGLDQSAGHRIIEFAARLYDLDTQKFLGKYVQRINPQRSIDPDAQRVHGISFDMLTGMPTIEQVAPNIIKVFQKSDILIAHNGKGFDFPFIIGELQRIGQPVPPFLGFDTMIHGRWATPLGKMPNLGELCFAADVEYDITQAHAADYDVDVMMQCFFVGLRQGVYQLPALRSAA